MAVVAVPAVLLSLFLRCSDMKGVKSVAVEG